MLICHPRWPLEHDLCMSKRQKHNSTIWFDMVEFVWYYWPRQVFRWVHNNKRRLRMIGWQFVTLKDRTEITILRSESTLPTMSPEGGVCEESRTPGFRRRTNIHTTYICIPCVHSSYATLTNWLSELALDNGSTRADAENMRECDEVDSLDYGRALVNWHSISY